MLRIREGATSLSDQNDLLKKHLGEMGADVCTKCVVPKRLPELVEKLPDGKIGRCEVFMEGECPLYLMWFGDEKPEVVFGQGDG